MVAIMVIAAPLIVSEIFPKSDNETLPVKKTKIAPIVAGIASFIHFGINITNVTVSKKNKIVSKLVNSSIIFLSLNE